MADSLEALAYQGDTVTLSPLALGAAGELHARREYGKIWEEVREEFFRGQIEGSRLVEKVKRTQHEYGGAEDRNEAMTAGLGRIFEAMREARSAPPPGPGPLGSVDDPHLHDNPRYNPFTWQGIGGGAGITAAGFLGLAPTSLAQGDLDKRMAEARGSISHMGAGIRRYDPAAAQRAERELLSRLAKATERTRLNIATARAFSWSAVAAGLAWSAVVVPSDEDIDYAVSGWFYIAQRCGEMFGHDTGPVREAIAAAWAGPAMEAADARLVEFLAAGVHLTERTRRLAQALSQTVRDMDSIFMPALIFSGAIAAAIAGLGMAARLNPALRPAVEFLGGRLGTAIVAIANLAPAVAAAAVVSYRGVDSNPVTKIGDREITGFRTA
ncbi:MULTISPECIES: hypothetical protein [unclassified Nonomuraea]|uniref:hypothetical protein n=1 Tax=unclassified Nonomuraea TaxID=2593643 RepID=UPI0033EAC8AF